MLEELFVFLRPPSHITADVVTAVLEAMDAMHARARPAKITLVLRGCPTLAGVRWSAWRPRGDSKLIVELRPPARPDAATTPYTGTMLAPNTIPGVDARFPSHANVEFWFVDRTGRHVQRTVTQTWSEAALETDPPRAAPY